MPNHALFYPEWSISDPFFLAESLLYWDRLSCIVPFSGFNPLPSHDNREMAKLMAEAHEQFITRLVPTDEQKKRVHQRLVEFARHKPPNWCRPENLKPERSQVVSAYKFAPETMDLLRNSGWASPSARSTQLGLQVIADSAANVLVGVLADECSSATMPPITNDPGSFISNCNSLLNELGSSSGLTFNNRGSYPTSSKEGDVAFLLAKLPHIGISKRKFDVRAFRRLLHARNDLEINQQRQMFCKKIDEYLERLRTTKGAERQMIGQEFEDDLKSNLAIFRKELKRAGVQAIFSKEGAIATFVGIGTGVFSLGVGLVFGLAGGLLGYQQKRREAFTKNWSSWVFSTKAGRFSVL